MKKDKCVRLPDDTYIPHKIVFGGKRILEIVKAYMTRSKKSAITVKAYMRVLPKMIQVFEAAYQNFKMDSLVWALESEVNIPPWRVYEDTLNGEDRRLAICAYKSMIEAIKDQVQRR